MDHKIKLDSITSLGNKVFFFKLLFVNCAWCV